MTTEICPSCSTPRTEKSKPCRVCGWSEPAATEHLPAGTVVGGKYRIEHLLGEGGFGTTYQATHLHLDRTVAIKELRGNNLQRKGLRLEVVHPLTPHEWEVHKDTFMAEAKLLASFQHPNIVQVTDSFHENNTSYLVMEHLQGHTLQHQLNQTGAFSAEETQQVAQQVLSALMVLHQRGVLHRDLKPDNLIQTQQGRIVLIDFGSARLYQTDKTSHHTRLITPGYAPLEQYAGQAKVGPYTDLYALGATLYHLVNGAPPPAATERLAGQTLLPVSGGIPAGLRQLIEHCLNIQIEQRPATAEAALQLLNPPSAHTPNPAPTPAPKPAPAPTPAPKKKPKPARTWNWPTKQRFPRARYIFWLALTVYLTHASILTERENHNTVCPKDYTLYAVGGRFNSNPKNPIPERMFDDCKRQANNGNKIAMVMLGDLYTIRLQKPSDLQNALFWYRKAAKLQVPEAYTALGHAYSSKPRGSKPPAWKRDMREALKWYLKAAEAQQADAEYQLGEMHWYGTDRDNILRHGLSAAFMAGKDVVVPIEPQKALVYHQRGAKHGSPHAAKRLQEVKKALGIKNP